MVAETSSIEVLVRVMVALGCAMVALILATRIKPATPGRPALVRVDRRPTEMYRPPDSAERWRTAGRLGGGAVIAGALLACALGFALAILLSLANGLLG